jgi:hypothetical protein
VRYAAHVVRFTAPAKGVPSGESIGVVRRTSAG